MEQTRDNARSAIGGDCERGAAEANPNKPMAMLARDKTGREVLEELICVKEQELADLNTLLRALPGEMNHRADRAFRRLVRRYE